MTKVFFASRDPQQTYSTLEEKIKYNKNEINDESCFASRDPQQTYSTLEKNKT